MKLDHRGHKVQPERKDPLGHKAIKAFKEIKAQQALKVHKVFKAHHRKASRPLQFQVSPMSLPTT